MTEFITDQKLNIVLDISKYDLFRVCEQRYAYAHLLNKHPIDKAPQLDRGQLVHLGTEIYYDNLRRGVLYDDCVTRALSAIRTAGTTESSLDVDSILRVIDVMEEYFDYWRVADQAFQIVDVEKSFLYLFHETEVWRFYLAGKIDLIITDNQYTNLPYDHKSYDRTYETTRMSNQFKNYVNALNSNFLVVNKIGMQKTLKPHEKFTRVPLSFDHLYLAEWKRNIIPTIDYYVDCMVNNYWPMNETSCFKFNRKCEYHDVCDSSGPQAKAYKLASMFIDGEPWDVTKSLKKTSEILLTEKKDEAC